MILIADSGSTKTEWSLLNKSGDHTTITTSGINPFFLDKETIISLLNNEFHQNTKEIDTIFFYGSGCNNPEKNNLVKEALFNFFKCSDILVESDLLGAARSLCQHKVGIACILGTGSNSCYYDGVEIANHVSPLGFILGDEGSGAVLGKRLVSDILKNQLPGAITDIFWKSHPTTTAEILENVYRKPFPNRYLASFTKFLSDNITNSEIERIVIESFNEFIARNLMQYPTIQTTEINFAGSIAYYFRDQLKQALEGYDLQLGSVVQSPMQGLISYHDNLRNF